MGSWYYGSYSNRRSETDLGIERYKMKRSIIVLLLMVLLPVVVANAGWTPLPKHKKVAGSYILNKAADSVGWEFGSDTAWITPTGFILVAARAYYTDGTGQISAQFKSSNATDIRVNILNTGAGNAFAFFDAVNGDITGSDYGQIGQYDDSSMGYDIGASATYAWHEFTVGNAQKLKIANAGVTFGGSAPSTDFTFPLTDGTNEQVLETDGSGNVSWQTPPGAAGGTTDSTFVRFSDSNSVGGANAETDQWLTPDDTLFQDTTDYLPLAGGTMAGAITMGTEPTHRNISAVKVLISDSVNSDYYESGIIYNGATSSGFLDFLEDADNGTKRFRIRAPADLAADTEMVLPIDMGTAGQQLTTDGDDSTYWAAAGAVADQSIKGDHVDSVGENFVFDDAYRGTSAEADSAYATEYFVKTIAGDSGALFLRKDGSVALTADWAAGNFDITGLERVGSDSGFFGVSPPTEAVFNVATAKPGYIMQQVGAHFGNATAGGIQIGDGCIFYGTRDTTYNSGALDLGGTMVFRQKTAPDKWWQFAFYENGGVPRFVMPSSGDSLGTWNPRSLIVAGPAALNDSGVHISYWGFQKITATTADSGADLGVQGKIEVLRGIFTDTIADINGGSIDILAELALNDNDISGIEKTTTDTLVATQINISGDEITDLAGPGIKVVAGVLSADTADVVADAETLPVSGNAVYDYVHGGNILLNQIGDPSASKTFDMSNKVLKFDYSGNISGHALEVELGGNSTADGVHVHQHTGNPTNGHLLHVESDDADVVPAMFLSGTDTVAIFGRTDSVVGSWIDTTGVYTGDLKADTVDISGDKIVDFNGGGLTVASNVLAVTDDIQNHTLDSAEVMTIIADSTIQLADMATNSVNSSKK